MDNEIKTGCGVVFLIVLVSVIIAFIFIGPAGVSRRVSAWSAEAYGSDWLVIQYAQNGSIINFWDLKGRSVGSEENSDGIFFKDNIGDVIHLSGHYVYIQTSDFEVSKKRYLKEK